MSDDTPERWHVVTESQGEDWGEAVMIDVVSPSAHAKPFVGTIAIMEDGTMEHAKLIAKCPAMRDELAECRKFILAVCNDKPKPSVNEALHRLNAIDELIGRDE